MKPEYRINPECMDLHQGKQRQGITEEIILSTDCFILSTE